MRRSKIGGISLGFVCLLLLLQGCASKVQVTYVSSQRRALSADYTSTNNHNNLLLRKHYEKWHGTPYEDGGLSHSGIDCSGYTLLVYRDLFGVTLPRTAGEQAESGRELARSGLRTGDLVFFNTGHSKKHVGVYLGNDQFIHASLSRGVTISSLDDSYWNDRYWKAVRVQSKSKPEQEKGLAAAYRQ